MNATEQIALLRRACEMVLDTSVHGKEVTDAALDALSATATPPVDAKPDVLGKADPSKVVCPSCFHQFRAVPMDVHTQLDDALAKLRELHDIIEQHHNGYGETGNALGWKKPESHAEALRDMLTEQVSMANNESTNEILRLYAELDTERMRLAACGVIAGCNTPDSYAINMRMHDSFKSGSLEQVAAAVRREIDLRDKLAEKEKELADIDAEKPEPEFRADENRIQQRRLSWCHFATIAPQGDANSDEKAEAIAKRVADALNTKKDK